MRTKLAVELIWYCNISRTLMTIFGAFRHGTMMAGGWGIMAQDLYALETMAVHNKCRQYV